MLMLTNRERLFEAEGDTDSLYIADNGIFIVFRDCVRAVRAGKVRFNMVLIALWQAIGNLLLMGIAVAIVARLILIFLTVTIYRSPLEQAVELITSVYNIYATGFF